MGKRRLARELVLKSLYAAEIRAEDGIEVLDECISTAKAPSETAEYARRLFAGITEHGPELERTLSDLSENWPIERLALIDKNLIKLGLCEVLYFSDIPPKAAINEAVELAKRYCGEKTPDFVNGILDRAARLSAGEA